ncbi:MAG: SEC-C metal-binding domain-containing protein [Lachnospirales bacterium]
MSLYEDWVVKAYDRTGNVNAKFWDEYTPVEQKIYEDIIGNKVKKIEGTITELSEKYDVTVEYICGFLDGINDINIESEKVDVENLTETTNISMNIDFEKLFKKMVEYKAEHLYELPQWKGIFDEETLRKFYKEEKKSKTVVNEAKVGRNEPCPCGSGKKYKACCGA